MSRSGKRIIRRFPEHSCVHDKDNAMNGLLDYAVGEWFDRLEGLIFQLVEKRKIITNISDESDPTSDDYLLGGYFLDIQGDARGLVREENETNTEYRARILGIIQNDISLDGIRLIIASILNISVDEVEIINNRDCLKIGDMIFNRLVDEEYHKRVFNRLVRARGIIQIKVPEVDDPKFLKDTLKQVILANVEIVLLYTRLIISPDSPHYADVGDDVDFSVILLDQDDKVKTDENIVFYQEDSIIGTRVTDEEGKATIKLNNVKVGTYLLKGRFNKTWSPLRRITVKYGLNLVITGPNISDGDERLKYVVNVTNKKEGNIISGLTVNWYVNSQQVFSCITDDYGQCAYCFVPSEHGIHEIYAVVEDNEMFHTSSSNKILLDVNLLGYEPTDNDCIVDFYADTRSTVPELEEVKEIAKDISLYGEKWIPWEFPLEDVEEFFNLDYSNILFLAYGTKRLKHIPIIKFDKVWFLIELPYYKFNNIQVPIRAIIFGDHKNRFYFNPTDITTNYYDLNNGLTTDFYQYLHGGGNLVIDFQFLDFDTDEPLSNVDFSIDSHGHTTNDLGFYRLSGVTIGTYNVVVEHEGYKPVLFAKSIVGSVCWTIHMKKEENNGG